MTPTELGLVAALIIIGKRPKPKTGYDAQVPSPSRPVVAVERIVSCRHTSGRSLDRPPGRRKTSLMISMLSRAMVAALLLLGACSKSEPGTSTTASPAATVSPASTAVAATGAPTPTPPGLAADDDHEGHMKRGMPPGMPMHMHDGGMGHPMPHHPMPGHPMPGHE
jgi:hypothetical protein